MVDQEMTGPIVQTACFCAGIKSMDIDEESFKPGSFLYYCDPTEGTDKMGKPVKPSWYVDISDEIEVKDRMPACHESQRSRLLSHHESEYIFAMKRFSEKRGKEVKTGSAKGFRQHPGHGSHPGTVLNEIPGESVIVKTSD